MSKKNINVKPVLPKVDTSKGEKRVVSGVRHFQEANRHWYDLDTDSIAASVRQVVIQIDNNNRDITEQWEIYAGMYGSYTDMGFQNHSSSHTSLHLALITSPS